MILKAIRIATGDPKHLRNTVAHILRGEENGGIAVLHGAPGDVADMRADALAHPRGARYCVRHYVIAPEMVTTRDQAMSALCALGEEFGFDAGGTLLVEHCKPRQDGAGYERHWHALVPEVDPVHRRVLDAHHMRVRHEKVARVLEARLGHRLVKGAHNRAVAAVLANEAPDVAAAMAAARLTEGAPARASYTHGQHQAAKRGGRSMPVDKAAVAVAWATAEGRHAFEAALAANGMRLASGKKPGVWVIETADGALVGALDRLLKAPRTEIAARLEQSTKALAAMEETHEPADTEVNHGSRRSHDHREAVGPRPHRLSHPGELAALTVEPARPGDAAPAMATAAARDAGREAQLSRAGRDTPSRPSRAGRCRAEAAALAGEPFRLGDAALTHALPAATTAAGTHGTQDATRDAALVAIHQAVAKTERRVRLRAEALAAEAVTVERLRDAEDARRLAGRALDGHDERRPRGIWAWITGREQRWRQKRARLDTAFVAAVAAERATETTVFRARGTITEIGRDGSRDAERLDSLRAAEAAVRAGSRDVAEAAARGDITAALRPIRPPRPVPRDDYGTPPTPEPAAAGWRPPGAR